MSRGAELVGAFMLLTRLPVGRLCHTQAPAAACVWAYPLVGAVVGACGGAVFALARLALPPAIAGMLAVATTILVTGGLHEDGLADTADGFGGGRTMERKLEIMRDSRIGSFGALALILSLGLRVDALATIASPGEAAIALVVAGALGRGAILGPVLWLNPSRANGLAAPLASRSWRAAGVGMALAAGFALAAPAALPAATAAAVFMTRLTRRLVGGYTGDVLGATEQCAECAVLVAIVAFPLPR